MKNNLLVLFQLLLSFKLYATELVFYPFQNTYTSLSVYSNFSNISHEPLLRIGALPMVSKKVIGVNAYNYYLLENQNNFSIYGIASFFNSTGAINLYSMQSPNLRVYNPKFCLGKALTKDWNLAASFNYFVLDVVGQKKRESFFIEIGNQLKIDSHWIVNFGINNPMGGVFANEPIKQKIASVYYFGVGYTKNHISFITELNKEENKNLYFCLSIMMLLTSNFQFGVGLYSHTSKPFFSSKYFYNNKINIAFNGDYHPFLGLSSDVKIEVVL